MFSDAGAWQAGNTGIICDKTSEAPMAHFESGGYPKTTSLVSLLREFLYITGRRTGLKLGQEETFEATQDLEKGNRNLFE